MIRLFNSTDTDFSTNGVGQLPNAISCIVTEKRNGEYELAMKYPITGKNYDLIGFRKLIVAKPNPYSDPQPFRIYSISKPINGIVEINAEHISYDMSGYSVSPFSAGDVVSAFSAIKASSVSECPFEFWTDKSTAAYIETTKPLSMRSILGGMDGSILDTYRGEYEFDVFTVKLHNNRGSNKGVSIRYGKNLTDLKQEENCSNVYTAIHPYWYSEDSGLIELQNKLVPVDGDYDYVRILPVDMSDDFDEPPTEEQLEHQALMYISTHDIGIPKVSLTVSFVNLSSSEEYKSYSLLEDVRLCDTVNVEFPKLNVSATAQCIETKYNVITEKYDSIELGNAKSDLVETISAQKKDVREVPSKSFLEKAIAAATNLITGHSGGYVVHNPAERPSEILILDSPSLEEATNVWRWNGGGLGYSSNGYNGPFELAITMDGAINANFITAGIIDGSLIRGSSIESSSISQYYKSEVTNEIGEATAIVEQSFIAANEQVKSIISDVQTALLGDVSVVQEALSSLRQTVDSLTLSYSNRVSGGINFLQNSSGLNGLSDDWEYTGVVTPQQTSEAINNTSSGSMFRLKQATLSQQVNVVRGKTYSLSLKAKRDTNDRCYALINNGDNIVYIFDEQESCDWTEYSISFTAYGDSITVTAGTTGYYFYVADLMMVEGPEKSNWTPAPNEIYTTNVKVDKRGINITNSESDTETIIDNTQFAVKHQNQTVLTVNKDLTTLRKTEVTDEFTIGRCKFIPVEEGLDIVLLD